MKAGRVMVRRGGAAQHLREHTASTRPAGSEGSGCALPIGPTTNILGGEPILDAIGNVVPRAVDTRLQLALGDGVEDAREPVDEQCHQQDQDDDPAEVGRGLEPGEELEEAAEAEQLGQLEDSQHLERLPTASAAVIIIIVAGCSEEEDNLPRDRASRIDGEPRGQVVALRTERSEEGGSGGLAWAALPHGGAFGGR